LTWLIHSQNPIKASEEGSTFLRQDYLTLAEGPTTYTFLLLFEPLLDGGGAKVVVGGSQYSLRPKMKYFILVAAPFSSLYLPLLSVKLSTYYILSLL
jgi:hypothetical protein